MKDDSWAAIKWHRQGAEAGAEARDTSTRGWVRRAWDGSCCTARQCWTLPQGQGHSTHPPEGEGYKAAQCKG